jgi:HEAT repeat protein
MSAELLELIDLLTKADGEVRSKAYDDLVEFGARAVGPLLTAFKGLPDQDVASDATTKEVETAYAIAAVLSEIGEPAVEPLINALHPTNHNSLRCYAAYTLSYIADRRAVNALTDAIQSSNDLDLRRCAVVALGSIGDAHSVNPLLAVLADPDLQLRIRATAALGSIGDTNAVKSLIDLLSDPSIDVRLAAIRSLARLGDSRAVEPLISLLHDKEQLVQYHATIALGDLGDPRAAAPLLRLGAEENDRILRYHAAASLLKLGYSVPLHELGDYNVDLLALLHLGETSPNEAYRLYDRVMDGISTGSIPPDWAFALGLSEYEARAFLWGANLQDLLEFRYGGWPAVCSVCRLPIDYRIDNWVVSHDSESGLGLQHIDCVVRP